MFEHPDLDGQLNRLLGRALLELRDPSDGFLPDPGVKSRHQLILCNGLIYERRIPPGETPSAQPLRPRAEDSYQGAVWPSLFRRSYVAWNSSLIYAWRESVYPGWPPPDSLRKTTVSYTAHTIHAVTAGGPPDSVTCPDCGDLIARPVDEFAQGLLCDNCGGEWYVGESVDVGDADPASGEPVACWSLHRVRSHTKGRV